MTIASDFRKCVSLTNTIKKKRLVDLELLDNDIENLVSELKKCGVSKPRNDDKVIELKKRRIEIAIEIRQLEDAINKGKII